MMKKRKSVRAAFALLLAAVMIIGVLPVGDLAKTAQAAETQEKTVESETKQEKEIKDDKAKAQETLDESETQQEKETKAGDKSEITETEKTKPTKEQNAKATDSDQESKQSETPEEEQTPEEPKDASDGSSISGVIWLDKNSDGIYDNDEKTVAGYTVCLYKAEDKKASIEQTVTDADGSYQFTAVLPGTYRVGISSNQVVEETEYLVPIVGISDDNQFDVDVELETAYTDEITIEADTIATDYHAGVRLPEGIQATVGMKPGEGPFKFEVNKTVIGFAGYEWWVIGDSKGGVNSPNDKTITLSNKGGAFQSAFNPAAGTSQYENSKIQQELLNKVALRVSSDPREDALIVNRSKLDQVGEGKPFNYIQPKDQKLWLLSLTEWTVINNDEVRSYLNSNQIAQTYWLRTPYSLSNTTYHIYHASSDGKSTSFNTCSDYRGMRYAFYLTLPTNNLFISEASGTGMKSVNSGNPDLELVEKPTGTFKMTLEDNTNLSLTTTTTNIVSYPGGPASFQYSGAQTGTGKSVSVMICDKTSGDFLYYGRPVDTTSGNINGNATFTIPTALPIGDYTLKVFNEEVQGANFTDYASTPQEIDLKVREVSVDLSCKPVNTKIYDGTVDIEALVGNHIGGNTTIEDAKWFRVPNSDNSDYSMSFDTKYTAISNAADKGTITKQGSSQVSETFKLTADKNGIYWVQGAVNETGYGVYTTAKPITVDNIYQTTSLAVRGEDAGSNPMEYLYNYETISGTYGIPFDLDGTTVIASPSLGFDTVVINAKNEYTDNWDSEMKSIKPLPFTLTLDGNFSANSDCDNNDETKYTISYTKKAATWKTIDVTFYDESGQPINVNGGHSDQFSAPLDATGGVSTFLSSGATYIPPSDTLYHAIGYGVGNTYVAADVNGSAASPVDFTTFDPAIPAGTNDVYIVYRANTTTLDIGKTVTGTYGDPNIAFEITVELVDGSNSPITDNYTYTGSQNGTLAVTAGTGTISLKHGEIVTIAGLPIGATYTVRETDSAISNNIYTATYSGSGTVAGNKNSISETLTSASATIAIVNDRSTTGGVPGGIDWNNLIPGMILLALLLAATGAGVATYVRRKKAA